jgi:hypothetical protein
MWVSVARVCVMAANERSVAAALVVDAEASAASSELSDVTSPALAPATSFSACCRSSFWLTPVMATSTLAALLATAVMVAPFWRPSAASVDRSRVSPADLLDGRELALRLSPAFFAVAAPWPTRRTRGAVQPSTALR